MRTVLPGVQGLSSSNLRYMKKFYEIYSVPDLPQPAGDEEDFANVPQVAEELSAEELFSIPWGHQSVIINKCKGDSEKSIFLSKKLL